MTSIGERIEQKTTPPNEIKGVIVACYKKDYWLAKIAIASIRYFYKEIPIYILLDFASGAFSISEVKQRFNVQALKLNRNKWGNPCSKLSMLRSNLEGRHLFIDSDICLIGRVLHELSKTTEDFIVSPSRVSDPHSSHVGELYYDFSDLQKIDPDFQYPGYVFNSGQYVFTANKIPQERIDEIWDLKGVPKKKNQVFRLHDQGGFNYLLQKLDQQSIVTVGLVDFKIFASIDNPEFTALTKNDIASGRFPKLVHWAGDKGEVTACFTSQWILEFFEDFYYSEVRYGCLKKKLREFGRRIAAIPGRVLTKIKIIGSRIKKLRYSISK